MYPSTVSTVQDFLARQTESHVKSREPGAIGSVRNYDMAPKFSGRISTSLEEFKEIDSMFRTVTDFEGKPMIDIARRYWDDPNFAEQQRKNIAEEKARRGKR